MVKPSRISGALDFRLTAKRRVFPAPLSLADVVVTLESGEMQLRGSIGGVAACRLRGRNAQRFDCRDRSVAALPTHTATPSPTPTLAPTSSPTPTRTSPPPPTATPTLANVALGRPAQQAAPTFEGHVAGKAVDGNTNGNLYGGSVTHTDFIDQAWWEVDLGSVFAVQRVSVWNRTDCCSARLRDFYVFVSEEPFTSTSVAETLAQSGVSSEFHSGEADVLNEFPFGANGRYVRVQLSGAGFLQLAEVQVYAESE